MKKYESTKKAKFIVNFANLLYKSTNVSLYMSLANFRLTCMKYNCAQAKILLIIDQIFLYFKIIQSLIKYFVSPYQYHFNRMQRYTISCSMFL